MTIYLHKILPLLVSPLFLFLGVVFLYSLRYKLRGLLIATIALSLLSLPFTANKLWHYLESDYVLLNAKDIQPTEAIVVLSGSIGIIKTADEYVIQWGNPNRFFGGIQLFKHGKAPTVIFTGGRLPWDSGTLTEGIFLRKKAIEFGVPKDNILVTSEVQNTAQEADAVEQLIAGQYERITLVTSAFHMLRASRLFEQAGFVVTPFPVDFKGTSSKITPMSFIPSTGGLNGSFNVIRELLGRLYYALFT